MPKVKCPFCEDQFRWTKEMGARTKCPHCDKSIEVVMPEGGGDAEARPRQSTSWGTDGFRSDTRRQEYGEIKKGDVLGGFRIEEMVGAGAMAVVYRATQLSLDRAVALKILPKEFARKSSFVRQFDSETDLLATLNHNNIVSIIDRGREGETYFFAMEYVEGTTLAELLASGQVDEEFLARIMEQCAEALVYAHSKGIVHRDLKPANIMLNDQGVVKIADFGVAGLIAEAGVSDGKRRVMGTRGYMPPEQEIHINRTDERSDIFSFGAVMYRALTNSVPDHLPPSPPSKVNPEVDPRIDGLVMKCLEIRPEDRYQSAAELAEAVRGYHRAVVRMQEVCPNCNKENPVTQRACLHCGTDLAELFDVCTECGAENRIDVEICMSCGRNLSQIRREISVRISKIEEHARKLVARHRYDEALAEMQKVLETQGKVFRRARERAERLIESYREQRAAHHEQLVVEAKGHVQEGRLAEAEQIFESLPQEFAGRQDVSGLVINIKSRRVLAQSKLEDARKLLAQHSYDGAEEALQAVRRTWNACPGLEELDQQLKAGRETHQMVEYELGEARRHLEENELEAAREALQFAVSAMPDHPGVKELKAEIDKRGRDAAVRAAFGEGKKAFEEGDYREALRRWSSAAEMLPDGDPARAKLDERIARARQKYLEEADIVRLEAAPVVRLDEAAPEGGLPVRMLVPALLAGAALLVGLLFIVVIR